MSNLMYEGVFEPVRVEARWMKPRDPQVLALQLESLDTRLDHLDFTPALEIGKGVIAQETQERFETETDPSGSPWAEWADSYRIRAASENIGKLRKHAGPHPEELYKAATDPGSYQVSGGALFIDEGAFPIYWGIQQFGGEIKSRKARVSRRRLQHEGRHGEASRHGQIPARPYLGVSREALEVIGVVAEQIATGEIIRFIENPLFPGAGLQPIRRTERGPRFAGPINLHMFRRQQ